MKKRKNSIRYLSLILVLSLIMTMLNLPFTKNAKAEESKYGTARPDILRNTVTFILNEQNLENLYVAGTFNGWKPWLHGERYKVKKQADPVDNREKSMAVLTMIPGELNLNAGVSIYGEHQYKYVRYFSESNQSWFNNEGKEGGNESFVWEKQPILLTDVKPPVLNYDGKNITFAIKTKGVKNAFLGHTTEGQWKELPMVKGEDEGDKQTWTLQLDMTSKSAGEYEYKYKLEYFNVEKEEFVYINDTKNPSDDSNSKLRWNPPSPPASEKAEFELISSDNVVSDGNPVELVAVTVDHYKTRKIVENLKWEIEQPEDGIFLSAESNLNVDGTIDEGKEITVKAYLPSEPTKVAKKVIRVVSNLAYKDKTPVHFFKHDGKYDGWNHWVFKENVPGRKVEFNADLSDLGKTALIDNGSYVIVRRSEGNAEWLEQTKTYLLPEDAKNIYLIKDDDQLYTSLKDAYLASGPQIRSAIMDETDKIKAVLSEEPVDGANFRLYKNDSEVGGVQVQTAGNKITISGITDFDPTALYEIKADHMFTKNREVIKRRALDGYTFDGEMGANYKGDTVEFRVWAPTAQKVELLVYHTDKRDGMSSPDEHFDMLHNSESGTYHITKNKMEVDRKYYLYRLTFRSRNANGILEEKVTYAVDPYAIATGLNGKLGYIVNIDDANLKPENWANDKRPELEKPEDSIIYEMHVRDFTISEKWGGNRSKAGKFLGIAEEGTKYTDGVETVKTGLDHLEELGVTHVHLLPVYDIASIEEEGPHTFDAKKSGREEFNRNWGYDPQNYNALEGSYAMDPTNPSEVIKEFRTMVQALHKKGIRVVLDQVYNHMYSTDNMDKLVPGYYFRTNEEGKLTNGAGCGNEVATERPMVRKFIVDSNLMWLKNYKIDGLRFDLMALIDKETMNQVQTKAKEIDSSIIVYGEPWHADHTPLPEEQKTKKGNQGIGAFNDTYRNALRGNNDPSKGFVQGETGSTVGAVHEGLKGSINGTVGDPELIINYVEAHDNYAIWDQIEKSEFPSLNEGLGNYRKGLNTSDLLNDWKVKKSLLASGFVLTSQGIPFFQGGSEILRTKHGDHNSYKSNDTTNAIHWEDKITYKKVFEFYRDLIKIRKEHKAFRMGTADIIRNHQDVNQLHFKNELIFNHMKNNAGGEKFKNIVVIYNGSIEGATISWLPPVPSKKWKVLFDKDGLHETDQKEVLQNDGGNLITGFTLSSSSFMILYDEEGKSDDIRWDDLFSDQSADYMSPLEPSSSEEVTVRFRTAVGDVKSAEVHYYDEKDNTNHQVAMTKVSDADFYTKRGYDRTKVEFWEGKIPAGESRKYYHFKVINGTKSAWISGGRGTNNRGVTETRPAEHGFWIVPNYQTPKWAKEAVFYQIMVDRFRDGDPKNNRVAKDVSQNGKPSEISPWGNDVLNGDESDRIWNNQFFGGDLVGVKEALPYLDYLGITSLYLMPIFQSGSDHKYDTDDYNYVDKNFGGNKALADLRAAMQAKDMKLVLDGVFNHTSTEGELFKEHKKDFYFYEEGAFKDKANPPNAIDFYPWHGFTNLAKLNYSKDEVRNYIYRGNDAIAKRYLRAPYSIDGWRLDAAEDVNIEPRDYVRDDAIDFKTTQDDKAQREANLNIWKEFRTEVKKENGNAFILGEFWKDDNQWYKERAWDSKMNYGGFMMPFINNNGINHYFKDKGDTFSLDNKNGLSVADIGKYTRDYFAKFPYQTILTATNSISTHDQPRFLNREFTGRGNAAMMQLAATLQMTYPGVPMIYYGDEIGTVGKKGDTDPKKWGKDPFNRGTFNWDKSTWSEQDKKMFKDHKTLIETRKKNIDAFVYGAFEEIQSNRTNKYLAYARYGSGNRAIVILNNNGETNFSVKLENLYRYGFKNGDVLHDVLSDKTVTIRNDSGEFVSNRMTGSVWVLADKKPAEVGEIEFTLDEFNDERGKLAPVEDAKVKIIGNKAEVSWKAYTDLTGTARISIGLYKGNERIAEKSTEPTETTVTFDTDELDRADINVQIKVIADRTKKLFASDATDDGYFDSDFVEAEKTTQSVDNSYLHWYEDTSKKEKPKKEEDSSKKENGGSSTEGEGDLNEKTLLVKKEKQSSATVPKEDLHSVLTGEANCIIVVVKKGSIVLKKRLISNLSEANIPKLQFEIKVVSEKKDRAGKKQLKKVLKQNRLLSKEIFEVVLKVNGKKIKETRKIKEKPEVFLSISLKKVPKNIYVMHLKTGKLVKAKYDKKHKQLQFKMREAGKYVVVNKVKKGKKK